MREIHSSGKGGGGGGGGESQGMTSKTEGSATYQPCWLNQEPELLPHSLVRPPLLQ